MPFTNDQWRSLIETKIAQVFNDTGSTAGIYSSLTRPDDMFAMALDHTLLKPDATPAQIDELCDQAIRYKFKVIEALRVWVF